MAMDKLRGDKTIVLHIGAATQFMHIGPVIAELQKRATGDRLSFYIFAPDAELPKIRERLEKLGLDARCGSAQSVRFLIFCNLFLCVDQGMTFPYFGCKIRACSFHGQPSKGNVFQRFNFMQINTLFFYGPLMRDNYLAHKKNNPNWPDIDCYDVGQPLSDPFFNSVPDQVSARKKLGLNPSKHTIIYAPSFEYCSSMATDGSNIIDTLLGLDINLIVKPHPAFYNIAKFDDEFNQDIPNLNEWRDKVETYNTRPDCIFATDGTSLDLATALHAADMMVTDFSGVAFDGILSDLKMVFWDCPLLYSDYLPRRYGVDGDKARTELSSNVGRDAGILVKNSQDLIAAIKTYQKQPEFKHLERNQVREQLLFNQGRAADAMANKVEEIIGVSAND